MLFFGLVSLFMGSALAMLSKHLDPNSERFELWQECQNLAAILKTARHPEYDALANLDFKELQVKFDEGIKQNNIQDAVDAATSVFAMATSHTPFSSKLLQFTSLMTKFNASFELFNLVDLKGGTGYETIRDRICFLVGITIDELSNLVADMALDMKSRQHLLINIPQQFLKYFFATLYKTSEQEFPALYWTLDHYERLFRSKIDESQNIDMKEFWTSMHATLPQFLSLFREMFKKEPEFVPENVRIKRFPIVDWALFTQSVMAMPKVSLNNYAQILKQKKYQLQATGKTLEKLKKDFEIYVRKVATQMDSQFPEQTPEDLISECSEKSSSSGSHEEIVEAKLIEPSSDALEVPKPTVTSIEGKTDIKAERKVKKAAKIESRMLKEKERHEKRLEHILVNEADDSDVAFYYGTKDPAANLAFLRNQKNQMCRHSFEASKRYQHSLFTGLTASGNTLNYLCSLMVSGNPDYEGFCDAHKDLGGIKVEKRNGNKLFLFNEPISYHKTLHAPHLSSRFDHVLYRRFYRNCGLHPYFFITE